MPSPILPPFCTISFDPPFYTADPPRQLSHVQLLFLAFSLLDELLGNFDGFPTVLYPRVVVMRVVRGEDTWHFSFLLYRNKDKNFTSTPIFPLP